VGIDRNMASDAIKTLEKGIRDLIKPEMASRDFSYEPSTRTVRRPSGECMQIVEFHIGVRTMAGKFTVNLAVFHPKYCDSVSQEFPPGKPRELDCLMEFRRRLSVLRDTPLTKFFRHRVRNTDNYLKWWLVTPTDKWWSFTPGQVQVGDALGSVRGLLLARGLDWLDQNSDVVLLKAAHEKLSLHAKVFD
jgi:hypothetical protein